MRVCDDCYSKETEDEKAQRVAWTLARFRAYLDGHLIPYFDCAVDTNANKARRVIAGTIFAAKKVQTALPAEQRPAPAHLRMPPQLLPQMPLGASATIAVEVMDVLWKYGPPGLAGLVLRREFIEAAELLRRVSCLDQAWPLSAHELTAAIYYILALKRGERGANPDFEIGEHQTAGCQVE